MTVSNGAEARSSRPGPRRTPRLLAGLLDAAFPPERYDGGGRTANAGLSAGAWARVTFLEDPVCDGCGAPFAYALGAGVRCPACLARPRAFDRARAACLYDEHSRELILPFKHADRPELGDLFALWIGRAGAELLADAEVVVPVPLHPVRLLGRRYNQAAEIARPLARAHGLTFAADALRRKRPTESQGAKSGGARRRNVAGAFDAPGRRRIEGKRVLLVDDVMTTGATLEACARALKAAGAAGVDAVVVARVREARADAI
jgi:ComF family protein